MQLLVPSPEFQIQRSGVEPKDLMSTKYPGKLRMLAQAPHLKNQTGISLSLDSQLTWQLERLLGLELMSKEPHSRQGTLFGD